MAPGARDAVNLPTAAWIVSPEPVLSGLQGNGSPCRAPYFPLPPQYTSLLPRCFPRPRGLTHGLSKGMRPPTCVLPVRRTSC